MKKIAAEIGLCFFLISLFPAVAVADEDDRYSIAPADTSRSSLSYEVKPGETVTGEVIVTNFSSKIAVYEVYAVDRQDPLPEDPPGAFALKAKNHERLFVGKWVTFAESEVTVDPKSQKKVAFTLSVPEGAELKSYEGGFVTELIRTALPESQKKLGEKEAAFTVAVGTRVAFRIAVKVTDNPQLVPPPPPQSANLQEETGEAAGGEDATTSEAGFQSYLTPINIVLGLIFLALVGYSLKNSVKGEKTSE